MKKIILTIASLLTLGVMNSCTDDLLDLRPPYELLIEDAIENEEDVYRFLIGAYTKISSTSMYGSNLFFYGDLLGDKIFRTNSLTVFTSLVQMSYGPSNPDDINFYRSAYDVIQNANMVINNELPDTDTNKQYKADAKMLRALSYFNLVNYYASSPKSGQYQEYGVPIITEKYNADNKVARSSVGEVYDLIISDLNYAIENAVEIPSNKIFLSKTAARLLLSRVYLTRQAPGDAQKALELARAVKETANTDGSTFRLFTARTEYQNYFSSNRDAVSENMGETVWELDLNANNTPGVNSSLPTYYNYLGPRAGLLAKASFYGSFPSTDIRTSLFFTNRIPEGDNPKGVWISKFNHISTGGNYTRNVKVFRVSEAYLNEIEALYQLGNNAEALAKLNEFATIRSGSTYTGANLLNDILTERNKEFFGEGQRFLDLKRYNLPLEKGDNCPDNCNVPADSKLFVFPLSIGQLVINPEAVQHPLWQ